MRHYPVPRLRRKANGGFFVRFNGRDHSLGSDEQAARVRYAKKLEEWAAWRAGAQAEAQHPARLQRLTVAQLAQRLLDDYAAEGRPDTARWYRRHLARWLGVHGVQDVLELTTADPARGRYAPPVVPLLKAYAIDLVAGGGYAPRTINHDLTAVKRLFNHGADLGLCPAVNWRGVRRVPQPRSQPEALDPGATAALIAAAEGADHRLGPWLRLNYLALLRPSETVALVCAVHAGAELAARRNPEHSRRLRSDARAHAGHFLPVHDEAGALVDRRGLFELSRHKTLHKGHRRIVVLTERALAELERATPAWSTPNAYAQACRLAGAPGAPHVMRDSAATRLRELGAARADVDRLLGHALPAVSESYTREAWRHLRQTAARLEL